MLLNNTFIFPDKVPNVGALNIPWHSNLILLLSILGIFLFPKLGPRGCWFLKPSPPKLCTQNSTEGFRVMNPQTSMGLRFVKLIQSYQSPFIFLFPFAPKKISLNIPDLLYNSFRSRKSWQHENGYGLQDNLCKNKVPYEIQIFACPFPDPVLNFVDYGLLHFPT